MIAVARCRAASVLSWNLCQPVLLSPEPLPLPGDPQVVLEPGVEGFDLFDSGAVSTGASIRVRGTLAASPGAKQSLELKAERVELVGSCPAEAYPLQKKRHTLEFLRGVAHLRPRTNTIGAVARVRRCVFAGRDRECGASRWRLLDWLHVGPGKGVRFWPVVFAGLVTSRARKGVQVRAGGVCWTEYYLFAVKGIRVGIGSGTAWDGGGRDIDRDCSQHMQGRASGMLECCAVHWLSCWYHHDFVETSFPRTCCCHAWAPAFAMLMNMHLPCLCTCFGHAKAPAFAMIMPSAVQAATRVTINKWQWHFQPLSCTPGPLQCSALGYHTHSCR